MDTLKPEQPLESSTNRKDKDPNFSSQKAQELIDQGLIEELANSLSEFSELDQNIAWKLVDSGFSGAVLSNLDSFEGLDFNFAFWVVDNGFIEELLASMPSFVYRDHQSFANALINMAYYSTLFTKLHLFKGVDHKEIAERFIQEDQSHVLAMYLGVLNNIPSHIALRLMDLGYFQHVADNLKSFQSLDNEVIREFLSSFQKIEKLLEVLDNLDEPLRDNIIAMLIREGKVTFLINRLREMRSLNAEDLAERLIILNRAGALLDNIREFKGLDHGWIASKLITYGRFSAFIWSLNVLNGVDFDAIIDNIDLNSVSREAYLGELVSNIRRFPNVDQNLLLNKILNSTFNGFGIIRDALNFFNHLRFDRQLADRLYASGKGWLVIEHLDNFGAVIDLEGEFYAHIAGEVLDFDRADILARNIKNLPFLNHQEVVETLVDLGLVSILVEYLDNFSVDHKKLAERLIDLNYGSTLVDNIKKFQGLDHLHIIHRLAQKGLEGKLSDNLDLFSDLDKLDPDFLKRLRSAPHGGLGIEKVDPHEDHKWSLNPEKLRVAFALGKFFNGKVGKSELVVLGFSEASIDQLEQIGEKIYSYYDNFLQIVASHSNFPVIDRRALLNPNEDGIRMTSLLEVVNNLVGRYIALEYPFNRIPQIFPSSLDALLFKGFELFLDVYKNHLPAYDRLYIEFDELRGQHNHPLEVYLGRDGIYAYLGRRAIDVARRRKLGLQGRRELKERGEVVEIKPRYLVFPRAFRFDLSYETKKRFLEQEGISAEDDPVFFDTGFRGSIPEHIMRVLGFTQEEIEKRIKLISAEQETRLLRGIDKELRGSLVNVIEGNAKVEDAATGLVLNDKNGKITVIAKPSTPREQFEFWMIEQAIVRHYWLRERYDHPEDHPELEQLAKEREEVAEVVEKAASMYLWKG